MLSRALKNLKCKRKHFDEFNFLDVVEFEFLISRQCVSCDLLDLRGSEGTGEEIRSTENIFGKVFIILFLILYF
jgi:hypothetical protein